MTGRPPVPIEARFWRYVEKTDSCWIWRGAITRSGYGQTSINRRSIPAHRVAYELTTGPIPDGLQLDHLCRNRACVNPEHLEPVTPQINVLRGQGGAAVNATKTHCPANHPYDAENTHFDPKRGIRSCKECSRRRSREWKRRRREKQLALMVGKAAA